MAIQGYIAETLIKTCVLERIALKFKIKNSSIYDPAGLHLQTLIDIHAVVYILFIWQPINTGTI